MNIILKSKHYLPADEVPEQVRGDVGELLSGTRLLLHSLDYHLAQLHKVFHRLQAGSLVH